MTINLAQCKESQRPHYPIIQKLNMSASIYLYSTLYTALHINIHSKAFVPFVILFHAHPPTIALWGLWITMQTRVAKRMDSHNIEVF